jgi:hypothetical protein
MLSAGTEASTAASPCRIEESALTTRQEAECSAT